MSSSVWETKRLLQQLVDLLPPAPTECSRAFEEHESFVDSTEIDMVRSIAEAVEVEVFDESLQPTSAAPSLFDTNEDVEFDEDKLLDQMPDRAETITTTVSNGVSCVIPSAIFPLILEDKDGLEGTPITRLRKIGDLDETHVFEEMPQPVLNEPCVFGVGENGNSEPIVTAIASQALDEAEVLEQMPSRVETTPTATLEGACGLVADQVSKPACALGADEVFNQMPERTESVTKELDQVRLSLGILFNEKRALIKLEIRNSQ